MNAAVTQRDALMPRQPRGLGLGLVLALIAHGLLVLGLAFSVNWRASEPQGIEAELWSATPQAAAPRANPPEPEPPAPQPRPTPPAPKPPEPVAPPQPKVELPDPQIAIEQARREAAREKADEERREAAKKAQLKREQDKLAEQKRDEAEREREKLADAKAEQERKKQQVEKDRAEAAQREKERQKNLARIMGQAGATGGPTDTGTAARSSGPSAGYAGRIRARIKPNILFSDPVSGNPLATVEVRLAPDGTIIGKRLVKSSGVKAWDDAVLRAIDRTGVLPRDVDGRVPPPFEIDFRPQD